MSIQGNALAGAFSLLSSALLPLSIIPVRNTFAPTIIPAEGFVIFYEGEAGTPDTTLSPRRDYYTHRAAVEMYVSRASGDEDQLYSLHEAIREAFLENPSLSSTAIASRVNELTIDTLDLEGAAGILVGLFEITIEYETTDE